MYDALLTLHLLSAAISFVTVVMFAAWSAGAPATRGHFVLADQAWNVSGAGLLIFGVWLALEVDGYELWDGWILGALVLFAAATVFGAFARTQALRLVDGDSGDALALATRWNWLRTLSILAILVLMVWKPGA